jgi:hypothetical protein
MYGGLILYNVRLFLIVFFLVHAYEAFAMDSSSDSPARFYSGKLSDPFLSPESKAIVDDEDTTPSKKILALSRRAGTSPKAKRRLGRILEVVRNIQDTVAADYAGEKHVQMQRAKEDLLLLMSHASLKGVERGSYEFYSLLSQIPNEKLKILVEAGLTDYRMPERAPYVQLLEDVTTRYAIEHILHGTKKGGRHFYPLESLSVHNDVAPVMNLDNGVVYAWPVETVGAKTIYPPSLDERQWFNDLQHVVRFPIIRQLLSRGGGSYFIGKHSDMPFYIEVIENVVDIAGVDVRKIASAYPIFSYTVWRPEGMQHITHIRNLETGEEKTVRFTADELRAIIREKLATKGEREKNPVRYTYTRMDGENMYVVNIGSMIQPFGFPLDSMYVEIPEKEIFSYA